MEAHPSTRPRSRRLQAIARRSSRRAAPRSLLDFLGVSWRLLRRLARLPFTPWKALRSEGSCVPPLCKSNTNCPASASLSQRKQARQPRRRAQRIKAKERPSVCSVHGASSTTAAGAAAGGAAGGSGGRSGEAKGGGGSHQAAGVSSGKEAASRKYSSSRQQSRLPPESVGEGSVVSLSPTSSCCAASVTSESRSGRTCSSSSGAARTKRLRETAGSSSSARKTSSSSAAAASRASEAAAARLGRGPKGGGGGLGPLRQYPAVHACRPRIFFITLSSVKRRAILRLSLAASRRGWEGEEAPSPSSLGGPSSSVPSWDNCAKLETTTTITTAATDKLGSPPPPTVAWPPLLPASAAAVAADTKTAEDIETSATGEEA
ncbi:hypothetical protein Emed_003795 [Eimeria media]